MADGCKSGPTVVNFVYQNTIGDLIETVDVHFYADDTVLYSSGSGLSLAFENAQSI
jgi:hypothetical protein